MTPSNEHYNELADLLENSLETLKPHLSEQDFADIKDYIEYAEYGLAYDLLIHLVNTGNLHCPASLNHAASKMGLQE